MAFFSKKKVEKEESRVDEFLKEERNVISNTEELNSAEVKVEIEKEITVEEIHHSFLTAMDALLNKEGILIEEKIDEDTLKLFDLGFRSVEKISIEKEKKDKNKEALKDIELTKYFAQHYPQNKFITDEQLEKICLRYNLIIGEPADYKGDIPQRCIKEIANFKLMERDEFILSKSSGRRSSYLYYATDPEKSNTDVSVKRFLELIDKIISETSENWLKTSLNFLRTEIENGRSMYTGSSDHYNLICGNISDTTGTNKNFLKVVAPITMMDITNKRVDEKNRLVNDVKDPIVLCPVKGGNLIISLWGAESEIEELKNPNLN